MVCYRHPRVPGLAAAALALLLAPVLPARPLEDSPEAVLRGVEELYAPLDGPRAPEIPGRREHDAHMLVRRAHRLLEDGAPPEVEERLRALLSPPPEAAVADGPRAPGEGGWRRHDTPHFRILFRTDGEDGVGTADADGDGIPDKVEWVEEAFELAYSREIEAFGYPSPPEIPEYKVVLKRLKVNALTHPEGGGKTWCEFNFAMREGAAEERIRQKFRAVAAHEFFHAVQALLNWNEADWWTEGSADWMSELVDPGNGFYRSNATLRLRRPEVGLASSEPFFPYAGSLLAAYLTPVPGKGEDLVKAVWLEIGNLARSARLQGSERRTFVKRAFERLFGNFEEVVVRFWPHVYLRDFPGGSELPPATRARIKDYPSELRPGFLPQPDSLGANFVELHPAQGHEGQVLRVRIEPESSRVHYAARVLLMGQESWRSVPLKRADDGSLEVRIHGLGESLRAATLAIVNVGRKKGAYRLEANFEVE